MELERIYSKSALKIDRVPMQFRRYLHKEIPKEERMIGIRGARGTGKTTFLLQLGKIQQQSRRVLYVALDDLFFTEQTLYDLASEFEKKGGGLLLLDEVHKCDSWSRELKLIYNDFPELQVVFTSSSPLDLYKGEADLSRRVLHYHLREMSFREYLEYRQGIRLPGITIDDLIRDHPRIALDLLNQFRPFRYFPEYLTVGAFPYYQGDIFSYQQKLMQTVMLTIEIDMPAMVAVQAHQITKIKRLLYVLASNVPFIPNISKLSRKIDLNRTALLRVLKVLERASLIHLLHQQSKSVTSLSKPDKIWLRNTNLMHAIAGEKINKGALRETFALQMLSAHHQLALPARGDLFLDQKLTFEIGGKNKSARQIQGINQAFLIKDDIEVGSDQTIPLWLLGFLY